MYSCASEETIIQNVKFEGLEKHSALLNVLDMEYNYKF